MDPMQRMVGIVRERYRKMKQANPDRRIEFRSLIRETVRQECPGQDFAEKIKELTAAYAKDKKERGLTRSAKSWRRSA